MNKRSSLTLLCLLSVIIAGCSKPDHVTTIKSPIEGVSYTVETHYGHGAVNSDYTRVYAHLERTGKATRVLVLSGENLNVSNIIWANQHENTFCLNGGITDTFRNEVTLIAGDASETIHSHLQEHCNTLPTAGPNSK